MVVMLSGIKTATLEQLVFPFPPVDEEEPEFPDGWDIFGPGVEEALAPEPPDIMGDSGNYKMLLEIPLKPLEGITHIPPPNFMAIKLKKSEDHWLKVEDWLAHFHVAEDDKIDRFKETLFG